VRPGSRTKISVPLVLPQNRLPERSASQTNRVTQRLWRAVEGPRRCLFHPCGSELFSHRPDFRNLAQSWGRKMITVQEKMYV
jgi:hypothetical protein